MPLPGRRGRRAQNAGRTATLVTNCRETSVELTRSMGVAQMQAGEMLQRLVEVADSALSLAESSIRNRVRVAAR
jgi:PleD family two-component response regulator